MELKTLITYFVGRITICSYPVCTHSWQVGTRHKQSGNLWRMVSGQTDGVNLVMLKQ
jgi:hypothetical protein